MHLRLTNDEAPYHVAGSLAQRGGEDSQVGRLIRDELPELFEIPASGLAGDLIGSALDDVNWTEIGEEYEKRAVYPDRAALTSMLNLLQCNRRDSRSGLSALHDRRDPSAMACR